MEMTGAESESEEERGITPAQAHAWQDECSGSHKA